MSDTRSRLTGRADEWRSAFDQSFALGSRDASTPMEDLLAIGLGSERYAVRLNGVAGLFSDRKITRVPGHVAALLGIAGFRGAIVPVYDLPVLLGHAPLATPRWLMLAASEPVALAFADFEGLLRVERACVAGRGAGITPHDFIDEVVRTPDLLRPIIHLPSVLDAIRQRIPTPAPKEEP